MQFSNLAIEETSLMSYFRNENLRLIQASMSDSCIVSIQDQIDCLPRHRPLTQNSFYS